MRKYRVKAASDIRITYGVELCEGLRHFPETDGYAASFEVLNNELDAAHNTRRGLRKPMLQKRAAFRFAHYNTDQTIRMIHGAVGIADGGRKNGPIAKFCSPRTRAGGGAVRDAANPADGEARRRHEAMQGAWERGIHSGVATEIGDSARQAANDGECV
ncbi:MAG: hypothetical protein IPM54_12965 [Polyangiaceae bacterium]|nr:hypothetical protein [Polyangiaceae bacterium]